MRLFNRASFFINDSLDEKNTFLYPDSVYVHDYFVPIRYNVHGTDLDYLDAQSQGYVEMSSAFSSYFRSLVPLLKYFPHRGKSICILV